MTGEPTRAALRFYAAPSEQPDLEWGWVARQLASAGTYWIAPASGGRPHVRPVWGVWSAPRLLLSVGSPVVTRQLAADPRVTVHLDSGTDVVIVEGHASRLDTGDDLREFLDAYNTKYGWDYTVEEYGAPTVVEPETVLAWRSAGWAGRDGFRQAAKWRFS